MDEWPMAFLVILKYTIVFSHIFNWWEFFYGNPAIEKEKNIINKPDYEYKIQEIKSAPYLVSVTCVVYSFQASINYLDNCKLEWNYAPTRR